MNYKREEHRMRLFSTCTYRDSFTGLWTSIARQQHFLKLTLSSPDPSSPTSPPSAPSDLPDPIQHAIRQRDGAISPYSSQIFQSYQIVYRQGQTVIVTNKTPNLIGNFFAVEDTDCPHRYFIGFAFSVGVMTESITGLIAYFNENGHCDSNRTILCERVLTTYDLRNGVIRGKDIHLYHQALIFHQVHRDTRRLILYFHYIPYYSESIEYHTSYYTNYTVPYCGAVWGESITLFKRFLHIPLVDTSLLFDLGSLVCVEENTEDDTCMDGIQRYFTIESYHLLQKEDIMPFLEIASLFPEKEYSDGYPLHCIQCHHTTVAANYTYKGAPCTTTYMGLGSSYCINCRIRYSTSKKQWLCAEIQVDGSICNSYLLESGCRSAASHSSDQTVLLLYDTPLLKYPYRQHVRIQWTPSEDAIACAQMSHFFSDVDGLDAVYSLPHTPTET